MKFDQSIIYRILLVILLTGTVYGFHVMTRSVDPKPQVPEPVVAEPLAVNLPEIDATIDSILVKYGVNLKYVRKKKIAVQDSGFVRIERQVPIPPKVGTVLMTAEFHGMAQRYGGRAVASENLKENSTTVHLEAGKSIVQSLVLRFAASLYDTSKTSEKATKRIQVKRSPAQRIINKQTKKR